jgi:hypothetical protein
MKQACTAGNICTLSGERALLRVDNPKQEHIQQAVRMYHQQRVVLSIVSAPRAARTAMTSIAVGMCVFIVM